MAVYPKGKPAERMVAGVRGEAGSAVVLALGQAGRYAGWDERCTAARWRKKWVLVDARVISGGAGFGLPEG